VAEFAALERERYLQGCRRSIIEAKERRAEAAKRRAAESDFLAAAREGKRRAALTEALNSYQLWTVQLKEATRTLEEARQAKADLSSSEAPLPALKKSLVDAGAAVEAAEIRLNQTNAQEAEPLVALERALRSAQRELALHLGKERARRIDKNLETLRKLDFDQTALNLRDIYNFERLAPCFKNIVRLDAIVEASRDQYGHATDRARVLLEVFGRLDAEIDQ